MEAEEARRGSDGSGDGEVALWVRGEELGGGVEEDVGV